MNDWDEIARAADDLPIQVARSWMANVERVQDLNTVVACAMASNGDYQITYKGNRFAAIGMLRVALRDLEVEGVRDLNDSQE